MQPTRQTIFFLSLLLLTVQCKKKETELDKDPEVYVSGEASIYSSIKFSSNRASHSLLWDFGDNGSSVEKEPTHIFIKEGDYIVKLTIDGKETATKPLHIDLGLSRITKERKWSRKLLTASGSINQGDTTFALKMITEQIIVLPRHKAVPYFDNAPEVHFVDVQENIVNYYSLDTATATSNALSYNATSDVVNIIRNYGAGYYKLQYASK